MKVKWGHMGGPWSTMTGILIRRVHLDIDREKIVWRCRRIPKREATEGTNPADPLVLHFQSWKSLYCLTEDSINVLFKPRRPPCIFTAAPETNTGCHHRGQPELSPAGDPPRNFREHPSELCHQRPGRPDTYPGCGPSWLKAVPKSKSIFPLKDKAGSPAARKQHLQAEQQTEQAWSSAALSGLGQLSTFPAGNSEAGQGTTGQAAAAAAALNL